MVTVENLINRVISTWITYDCKPRGVPISHQSTAHQLCLFDNVFDPYRAVSFQQFSTEGEVSKLTENEQFSWFIRMVLRWSCSSLTSIMYRYILPAVENQLTHAGQEVNVSNAELWTVYFKPSERFSLKFTASGRTETVEAAEIMAHNFIKLANGSVLDITFAQFICSGNPLQKRFFPSLEAYYNGFPGTIVEKGRKTDEHEIDLQLKNDEAVFKLSKRSLKKFVDDVMAGLEDASGMCSCCWFPGSSLEQGKSLQRCSRCRSVWYCGKLCQKMHYKKHKKNCVK